MKRTFTTFIASLLLMLGLVSPMAAPNASAINVIKDACKGGNSKTTICKGKKDSIGPLIQKVIRILLTVLGAIAVIMIIVGGIKYATSDGDSSKITSAKNTILYSIVGLVVALLAYAIVEFVVSYFA